MKTKTRLALVIAAIVAMGSGNAAQARGVPGTTLLVMPVRYTILQFGFDIASMRSSYLVSYEGGNGTPLKLYAWDNAADNWQPTSLDEYASGSLFDADPARTFLVGTSRDVWAGLKTATEGLGDVTRIQTLSLAEVANRLHKQLKFSGSEWRWLAGRYGFTLEDRNYERRKYGRYGPPGSRPKGSRPTGTSSDEMKMPGHEIEVEETLETVELRAPVGIVQEPEMAPEPAPRTRRTVTVPVGREAAVFDVPTDSK